MHVSTPVTRIQGHMAYVHIYTTRSIETMSEASKRIKAYCSLCSWGWRYAVSMRALIFPRLTRITRCFIASASQSGVMPLILQASSTTTRFSSRLSNFWNFTPRIYQKRPQKVRNPRGGARPHTHLMPLIAYWNPPFQNSRSATVECLMK